MGPTFKKIAGNIFLFFQNYPIAGRTHFKTIDNPKFKRMTTNIVDEYDPVSSISTVFTET
jgi:hypothetical protein